MWNVVDMVDKARRSILRLYILNTLVAICSELLSRAEPNFGFGGKRGKVEAESTSLARRPAIGQILSKTCMTGIDLAGYVLSTDNGK